MIRRSANLRALVLALALGACGQDQSPQSGPDIEVVRGQATVETVEVAIDPSDPSKADVVVRGYLADGCTRIDRVQVKPGRGDLLVSVTITTARPADRLCIQVIKPFQQRIAVDIASRAAGSHVVEINGVAHPVELGAK